MSLNVHDMVSKVLSDMDAEISRCTINGEFKPAMYDNTTYHDSVCDYIRDNAEINIVYDGVTTTTPPVVDPLSGTHTISLVSCSNPSLKELLILQQKTCVSADLFELNINAWWQSFISSLQMITEPSYNEVILFTPFILTPTSAKVWTKAELSIMNGRKELWTEFCTQIIFALNSLVFPIPSQATSISPGTGTVTFANII